MGQTRLSESPHVEIRREADYGRTGAGQLRLGERCKPLSESLSPTMSMAVRIRYETFCETQA